MKNNRVKGKVITKESAEEQMPCATKVIRLQMPAEMAKLFIGMPEGTDPDSADEEIIVGSDELTEDISGALAVRVADGSRSFMANKSHDQVLRIVTLLDMAKAEGAVRILKAIFIAADMKSVVADLDMLDICADHNPVCYSCFMEEFFEEDDISGILAESWLVSLMKDHMSQMGQEVV